MLLCCISNVYIHIYIGVLILYMLLWNKVSFQNVVLWTCPMRRGPLISKYIIIYLIVHIGIHHTYFCLHGVIHVLWIYFQLILWTLYSVLTTRTQTTILSSTYWGTMKQVYTALYHRVSTRALLRLSVGKL